MRSQSGPLSPLADRITVLDNGTTLAVGPPDEIRENAEVRRAYLEGKKDRCC